MQGMMKNKPGKKITGITINHWKSFRVTYGRAKECLPVEIEKRKYIFYLQISMQGLQLSTTRSVTLQETF